LEIGRKLHKGDVVSSLIEWREDGVCISYFVNEEMLGVVFSGLPDSYSYRAAVTLKYHGTRVK